MPASAKQWINKVELLALLRAGGSFTVQYSGMHDRYSARAADGTFAGFVRLSTLAAVRRALVRGGAPYPFTSTRTCYRLIDALRSPSPSTPSPQ